MYGVSARSVAIRFVIATAASATVCAYCSSLGTPPPRLVSAEIVDTAAITSSPSTIGIADSALYGESAADIDTTLNTLQSLGVQNIRIFVPWGLVEPLQGTYDWSYIDAVVDAAAARNMGVMAEINGTPTWASTTTGLFPGSGTPNASDFASFASTVATRYGNDISAYEIWNEPNSVEFSDPIDPASYTALLKAAYPAIKAANPNATVVAGAVGSVISFGNVTLDPVTFVQDMFADGAQGYFDALSFHPYQETLELSQGAGVPNSPLTQLNAIEQLLIANGDASDKVWISEYGLPTSDVSQQTQATFIQNLIDTWQTLSYAGPVFIYTAQDTDSASTNPNDTYGIYESDWTPKLAAAVIQQEIAKYANTNPLAVLAQQIANAFATAVSSVAQTLGQQIAAALVQAIANALASLGTTTPAATPAVTTKTAMTLTAAKAGPPVAATSDATAADSSTTSKDATAKPKLAKLMKFKAGTEPAAASKPSASTASSDAPKSGDTSTSGDKTNHDAKPRHDHQGHADADRDTGHGAAERGQSLRLHPGS
ncbi:MULTISPECIES: cellulase family glycosylhydrolase [unclassified Mycobacterium]|uniref:cellulase family glycosylhydrolase n=1 Tax=unclassified Mycobacterium TaxID=2642494 RepID=UPI0029C786FE|nr:MULTISPECIES: cellulase family glycosylhydrolase [unclassified Mycobacterium]